MVVGFPLTWMMSLFMTVFHCHKGTQVAGELTLPNSLRLHFLRSKSEISSGLNATQIEVYTFSLRCRQRLTLLFHSLKLPPFLLATPRPQNTSFSPNQLGLSEETHRPRTAIETDKPARGLANSALGFRHLGLRSWNSRHISESSEVRGDVDSGFSC